MPKVPTEAKPFLTQAGAHVEEVQTEELTDEALTAVEEVMMTLVEEKTEVSEVTMVVVEGPMAVVEERSVVVEAEVAVVEEMMVCMTAEDELTNECEFVLGEVHVMRVGVEETVVEAKEVEVVALS